MNSMFTSDESSLSWSPHADSHLDCRNKTTRLWVTSNLQHSRALQTTRAVFTRPDLVALDTLARQVLKRLCPDSRARGANIRQQFHDGILSNFGAFER
jgi:hypothetical protein